MRKEKPCKWLLLFKFLVSLLVHSQIRAAFAGEATITAEYQESRPELASAQKPKQASIRAVALAVNIFPGPVGGLTLDSKSNKERLTVTNVANKHQRVLLKAASLQVLHQTNCLDLCILWLTFRSKHGEMDVI